MLQLRCSGKKLSQEENRLYTTRKSQNVDKKEINDVFAKTMKSQESKPIFSVKKAKYWNRGPERL